MLIRHWIHRMRTPVRREGAQRYLLLTLLSFAISVTGTRLFLELTGYPQLGRGELHIAHVLWGGLILFMASVLPLILANRWVYPMGAIMAGFGVGLVIDEVGKFITQTNDYFHPAAAPIVYAFFLLTVLLYLQVRRPGVQNARIELYYSLEGLQEILDRDLDPQERATLESRLQKVVKADHHPDFTRLAQSLLDFLHSDALHLTPEMPSFVEQALDRIHKWEQNYVTRLRVKAVLVGGITALSVMAMYNLIRLIAASFSPLLMERVLNDLFWQGNVSGARSLIWFFARVGLEASVGFLLLLSAGHLIFSRENLGIRFGYFSLLLSLTTVDLLVFYFEQFSTILTAIVQFVFLLLVLYYQQRYLGGGIAFERIEGGET